MDNSDCKGLKTFLCPPFQPILICTTPTLDSIIDQFHIGFLQSNGSMTQDNLQKIL